jgi:hypothetical protein
MLIFAVMGLLALATLYFRLRGKIGLGHTLVVYSILLSTAAVGASMYQIYEVLIAIVKAMAILVTKAGSTGFGA